MRIERGRQKVMAAGKKSDFSWLVGAEDEERLKDFFFAL
jgi:hypothetical protein